MKTYVEISALVLAGFGVFIAIATFVFDVRRRRHRGISREEFVRAFAEVGTSEDIPATVYNFYTRSWFFGNITIGPDDSLEHLFNEGEEDIEEDAMLLMRKLGLEPLSEEKMTQQQPIRTIRDMILWLHWVRQHQEPST